MGWWFLQKPWKVFYPQTVEGALSTKLMHKCKMQRCMVSECDLVLSTCMGWWFLQKPWKVFYPQTVEGALSTKLMHKCKMQRCMVSEVNDMVLPHKYGNAQPNKSAMHTLYVSRAYLVLTALVLALISIECKAASNSLSDEISLAEVLKLYEYKLLDMRMSIMSFCQTMMFY